LKCEGVGFAFGRGFMMRVVVLKAIN